MPRRNDRPKRRQPEGHTCPASGCRATCPNHYLMCGTHWRMVPAPLQAAVYAEYAAARRTGWTPSQGVGPEALVAAQTDAIRCVNAKLAA